MEEKGNSESLLLHIEDFCPKQVARISQSKKHLTVRGKNRFEASTNQAIGYSDHTEKMMKKPVILHHPLSVN